MSPEPPSTEPPSPETAAAAPATAPAYVLAGADGRIVASSEVFNRLIGADAIAGSAVAAAISAVTSGAQELLAVHVSTADGGRFDARVEAVLNMREQRQALIETQVARPPGGEAVTEWFPRFAADSVAIVWLKDLDGRYIYINRQYTAQLGAEPEQVIGHDDQDLSQAEAIDGPRAKSGIRPGLDSRAAAGEPLQLEYTIPAFDRRPAFAALRFPVLDPSGVPLVVCGVASPAEHGEIAISECEHLLQVMQWFRGDAAEIRRDAMAAWGLTAVRPQGMEFEPTEEITTATAAELAEATARAEAAERTSVALEDRLSALQQQIASEHGRALDLEASLSDARGRADALAASLEVSNTRARTVDAAHARIRELESMVATASSAGVAAAEGARRIIELEAEVRRLSDALAQERAEREALEASQRTHGASSEQAAARHEAELREQARRHDDALRQVHEQIDAQLQHAHQQHDAELRAVREQLAGEREAFRAEDEAALDRLRAEHEAARQSLRQGHDEELAGVSAQLAAVRGQLATLAEQHSNQVAAQAERHTHELATLAERHQRELRAAEERRLSELREQEARLASDSSGGEEAHIAEIAFLKRMHQQELASALDQQALELVVTHDRAMAELRNSVAEEREAHEHHEHALSGAEDRLRRELNAANQRHHVELGHLREQLDGHLQEADLSRERSETRIADLDRDLHAARGRIQELESALAASRDHITRLERASAAATAAAAGPIHPMASRPGSLLHPPSQPAPSLAAGYPLRQPPVPPPPVHPQPVQASTAKPVHPQPAQASTAEPIQPAAAQPPGRRPGEPEEPGFGQALLLSDQPLLIGDDPRPMHQPPHSPKPASPGRSGPRQPGWDPAAQQALADALRGCLNLRSILSESVRLIGTGGGWDAVVAWVPNEREAKFSCAATWVRSPVEMARLETSMWQVRQDPEASAIGAAAGTRELAWFNDPGVYSDRHLVSVAAEGINTVVLMPVAQPDRSFAVIELCSQSPAQRSAQAEAALRAIELEIAAANQRLVDAATASQWGRRRR